MAETISEKEDRLAVMSICSRADRSVAVLEKAFIRNGDGRYFVLRTPVAAITPLSVATLLFPQDDD
jgi:hypothetical protein